MLFRFTAYSDIFNMGIALWLAIYLLARGHNNRSTFRMALLLLAIAFYYICAFINIYDPNTDTATWRAFAIIVAVGAVQNFTYIQLPGAHRPGERWFARGVIVFGLVTTAVLIQASIQRTPVSVDDELYFTPLDLRSPSAVYGIFTLVVSSATIYNLWRIYQGERRPLNRSFFLAVVLGILAVGYGFSTTLMRQALPRAPANGLIMVALLLLIYSVARHQVLVERRISLQDLPITALTIVLIAGIYILAALRVDLSPVELALFTVLAVLTHSVYGLVRQLLDQLFHRQESALKRQLRHLTRDVSTRTSLARSLDRGLAILYHNLQASGGIIAVRRDDRYIVAASIRSLTVGNALPAEEITCTERFQPTGHLGAQITWLAPAFAGSEQLAVIGIGPRKNLKEYTEADLDWLEEIAEGIGAMVNAHHQRQGRSPQAIPIEAGIEPGGAAQEQDEALLLTMVKPLDTEVIKLVEDGFRHIHDYIRLGRSPLAKRLQVTGRTHIQRGKGVQTKLVEALEMLHPQGERPQNPPPREWFNYIILHDAYIDDIPDREIMAQLYISEGTFYRTRRKALRGVARALMELEG